MSHGKSTDTVILVGGALLGAAAMYVLDPEAGARRRHRLAAAAESAYDHARSAAGDTLRHVGNVGGLGRKAQEIAAHLAHRAQASLSEGSEEARGSMLDRAREAGGRLQASLHDQADAIHGSAADRMGDLHDWIERRRRSARRQVRSWLGLEEPHGFGTGAILSLTAGCLAVGAGLMYFLDPHRGQSRRAWAVDQTSNCIRRTGEVLRRTGKDVAHRFHRAARDAGDAAGDYMSSARLDSEQLIQRIRSETQYLADRMGNIQFMADAGGAVTVTGSILQDDLDRLLMVLHRVPGVSHVINRLNVADSPSPQASKTP